MFFLPTSRKFVLYVYLKAAFRNVIKLRENLDSTIALRRIAQSILRRMIFPSIYRQPKKTQGGTFFSKDKLRWIVSRASFFPDPSYSLNSRRPGKNGR